jgi:hypothetical protein
MISKQTAERINIELRAALADYARNEFPQRREGEEHKDYRMKVLRSTEKIIVDLSDRYLLVPREHVTEQEYSELSAFVVERIISGLKPVIYDKSRSNPNMRDFLIENMTDFLKKRVRKASSVSQESDADDLAEKSDQPIVPEERAKPDNSAESHSSSDWTGRATPSAQARVVYALAPSALAGVGELIERIEQPLHNGGPVDENIADALAQLRQLHRELGELLRLVEGGAALAGALGRLRKARKLIFAWSAETYGLTVAGLPMSASATVVGCGVMTLLHLMTKGAVALPESATLGAAAAGVHGAALLSRR